MKACFHFVQPCPPAGGAMLKQDVETKGLIPPATELRNVGLVPRLYRITFIAS